MNPVEVRESILTIDHDHRNDGDGGYECVSAVREWMRAINEDERQVVLDVLYEFVQAPRWQLRGVALEVLIQEGVDGLGERLVEMVQHGRLHGNMIRAAIVGLLRIRFTPAARLCRDYVERALTSSDPDLYIIGPLARIDPDASLEFASGYLAGALGSGEVPESVRALCEDLLVDYLEIDDGLLRALVQRTEDKSVRAGLSLRTTLSTCLNEPWIRDRFGGTRVAATINELLPR